MNIENVMDAMSKINENIMVSKLVYRSVMKKTRIK